MIIKKELNYQKMNLKKKIIIKIYLFDTVSFKETFLYIFMIFVNLICASINFINFVQNICGPINYYYDYI